MFIIDIAEPCSCRQTSWLWYVFHSLYRKMNRVKNHKDITPLVTMYKPSHPTSSHFYLLSCSICFFVMNLVFIAEAGLSEVRWLWLILSQLYYLAARWSVVVKWIMNSWNWLSVTFIILMERQVRSGLTTFHANQKTKQCSWLGLSGKVTTEQ